MNIKTTSLHRSFVIHLTIETNINCNGKIAEVIFLTLLSWIWVLFPHFSIFQSPMVRLSASKLIPTLTTGRPLRANLEA